MDLFAEFTKRRGDAPPVQPLPAAPKRSEIENLEQLLNIAFAGHLRDSYLVPVLDDYQDVFFGPYIVLCPDEEEAQRRQKQKGILAFSPDELMVLIRLVAADKQKASGIIAAKRMFNGIVSR